MRWFWMAARKVSRSKRGRTTTVAPFLRGGVHERGEAVDVEEGQDREDAFAGSGVDGGFELGEVGGDLPVGEHHAFGGAGGAGGVRQGGQVLGGVEHDVGFGGRRSQHVDQGAVSGRAVADEDLADAAGEFGGAAGGVEQRGNGDDPAGRRVGELFGELLGGGERMDGGDGGTRAGGGVEGEGEGDGVGAVQGEYVAFAYARVGECGGDPPVEAVDLFVGEGGAVGAVDEGGGVAELGGAAQDRLVDGQVHGWDVCVLAAEHAVPPRAVAGVRAQYDLGRPRVWWET
jgi:hypothetical protein